MPGDGNHTGGSSNFADFTIAKANATVTVTGYTGGTYDSNQHTQTVTVTGVGSAGVFTASLSGTSAGSYASITVSGNAHLILNPGIYVIGTGGVTGVQQQHHRHRRNRGGRRSAPQQRRLDRQRQCQREPDPLSSTGDYAGLAIFQALTDASPVTISGNANLNLNGSFLYDANVQSIVCISGNARIEASMVVNELTISGNADDSAQ